MNEQELKKKANALRHEISSQNKKLKLIYQELGRRSSELKALRERRDELNSRHKELSVKAKGFREKRDKLNQVVKEVRGSRKELIKKIRSITTDISESKKLRDELNKSSKGTEELLESALNEKLSVLLEEDIPLKDEKRLYELVLNLSERLGTAKKASQIHEKIVSDFSDVKSMDDKIDSTSNQLKDLSLIADEYHKRALALYDEMKKVRSEANEYHKKLTDKYKDSSPPREQIQSIKDEIQKLSEELAPVSEALEKLRSEREDKRRKEKAVEAKEKLKSTKRISLRDFRNLLEHGGVSLSDVDDS